MKITTTLYIYCTKYSWEDSVEYSALTFKLDDDQYRSFVCEQPVVLEIPDNYDPTAQKIAALIAEQERAFEEYSKSVVNIAERISKLQALEYKA